MSCRQCGPCRVMTTRCPRCHAPLDFGNGVAKYVPLVGSEGLLVVRDIDHAVLHASSESEQRPASFQPPPAHYPPSEMPMAPSYETAAPVHYPPSEMPMAWQPPPAHIPPSEMPMAPSYETAAAPAHYPPSEMPMAWQPPPAHYPPSEMPMAPSYETAAAPSYETAAAPFYLGMAQQAMPMMQQASPNTFPKSEEADGMIADD